MRFTLNIKNVVYYFDTFSDLVNALHVADAFKPFEENCQFNGKAFNGDDSVDLVIKGIKFENYISFGLSDETRRAHDKFCELNREVYVL